MGYGPSDGGKLIALEEAKRQLRGGPAYTAKREQRGLVVQWPGTAEPTAMERPRARPIRPRRRVAPLRGWASTLIGAGVFSLVLVGVAVARILADQGTPTEASPADSTVPSSGATESLNAAAVDPSQLTSVVTRPSALQPPSRLIRFASKPLEPSYTVQAGDSLLAIGLRHNITAESIQAINNLPDRAVLSVGQRLVIP